MKGGVRLGPRRFARRWVVGVKLTSYRVRGFRRVSGHDARVGGWYTGREVVIPFREGEARILLARWLPARPDPMRG